VATQPSPLAMRVARYLSKMMDCREIPSKSRNPRYRPFLKYTHTPYGSTTDIYWLCIDGSVRHSHSVDTRTRVLWSAEEMQTFLDCFESTVGNKSTTATPSRAEKHRRIV